jgi:DNA-binding transcriptional ArsR family regulator
LLAEAKLVHVRQEGRQRFYSLNQAHFTVCCGSLLQNFAPTYAEQGGHPEAQKSTVAPIDLVVS